MKVKKQNKISQARKNNQRGAAMVETALVLTVALGMIVFIVDMGRILLTQQFISERARVAVRSAVVNNWTSDQVKNYVAYASTSAPDGGTTTPGFMGLLPSEVTYTTVADSGVGDARYQVVVQGVQMFTWIPYIAGKYNAPSVTATAPVQSQGATN